MQNNNTGNNLGRWVVYGLAFYAFATAILFPFGAPKVCNFICFPYWSLPTIFPAAIIGRLLDFVPISIDHSATVFTFSSAIIFYALLGLIIGSIYKLIKKNNG